MVLLQYEIFIRVIISTLLLVMLLIALMFIALSTLSEKKKEILRVLWTIASTLSVSILLSIMPMSILIGIAVIATIIPIIAIKSSKVMSHLEKLNNKMAYILMSAILSILYSPPC